MLLTLVSMVLVSQSCTTRRSDMQAQIEEVEASLEDFDHELTDSLALQVATCIELNGTPDDRLRAWRTVGRVYDRLGNEGYKAEAYRMAVESADTTQAYDTLLLATTLSEWAPILRRTNQDEARHQAQRAVQLAEEIGDTAWAMYFSGENTLLLNDNFALMDSAYHYLWQHGHQALAVDVYTYQKVFVTLRVGDMPDSCALFLDRFAHNTRHNITHPHSWWATQYWLARGLMYQQMGERDSCLHYLKKVARPGSNARNAGYRHLSDAYKQWGEQDSVEYCTQQMIALSMQNQQDELDKGGRMLSHLCQNMRTQMQHDEATNRLHTAIALVIVLIIVIVIVLVFRQRTLRRQHQELLQQNAEYAAQLNLMKNKDSILKTPIVKQIHEMSTRDAHPTAEEWRQLHTLVEDLHPHLFLTLSKDYTLTEQEQHAVCLIVAKCTPSQMSVLLVYSKSNVSNLRRRLYRKLTGKDGSGADLDELVNGLCG